MLNLIYFFIISLSNPYAAFGIFQGDFATRSHRNWDKKIKITKVKLSTTRDQ
jgi:hypothetical protein